MNIELLTKIAEWLEGGAKHQTMQFDMTTGITFNEEEFDPDDATECQSSCCIAGAAVQFHGETQGLVDTMFEQDEQLEGGEMPWWMVREKAADALGLDRLVARGLFDPANYDENGREVFGLGRLSEYNDPAWAARVIRKLIATGNIDWVGTRPSVY